MADRKIACCVQSGNSVKVYDEKNCQIGSHTGELVGYTADTVSVKRGNTVRVFNVKGAQIGSHSTR